MNNIWVPVSGQIAQQQKVETLANNIANVNTPGFKRDQVVFKEYLTELDNPQGDIDLPQKEWAPEDFYRSYGAENAMVKVDGQFTDFTQGQLKPTGNSLDIGIYGKGFFEVLTPHGVRFTRKGRFSINKDGELVTLTGFKVLSYKGNQSELKNDQKRVVSIPQMGKISVSQDGSMYVDGKLFDQISLVEFKDVHELKKEGKSLYYTDNLDNIQRELKNTNLHQGYIEGSNVNAIKEMSELINAHRHFETIQNAVKAYDTINGKAVNEISKF